MIMLNIIKGLSGSARLRAAVTLFAVSVSMGTVQAAGDIDAGAEKAATCVACHGADGISQIATYPILAGQYSSYLTHALESYRNGTRENAIMAGFAGALSDQDIADLSAYFASLPGPLQTAPRN